VAVAEEFDTYQLRLSPRYIHIAKMGSTKLTKLRTIELQDFFNSFSPRLASKTIRNRHGCLRAVLNQGKARELVRTNPAGRPLAAQESKEASGCTREARYNAA
jgi:hypothetical protein